MEMQTLKDSTGPVFVITDLLRGVRYFIADKGSHYEIEVPTKDGYVRVGLCLGLDLIEVADELVSLLDNAKSACFTLRAAVESSWYLDAGRTLNNNADYDG